MTRTEDATTSFDLFLDTICNTFGGIVFLAILLAIMIMNRSVVHTDEAKRRQATPDEVREVMAALEDTKLTHERVKIELAGMPKVQTIADDLEYRELINQQEQLQSDLAKSLVVESELSESLSKTMESNAVARGEIEDVPKMLAKAKKSIAKSRADYAALVDSKQQTLRVPKVRNSSGSSTLLLVKGMSVYRVEQPISRTRKQSQVITTKEGLGIKIVPIAGSGWDLTQADGQSRFKEAVMKAKSERDAITIAIWPDTFHRFASLRETMVKETVFYQLWPQSAGETLVVYMGSGSSSVQ